MRRLALTFAPYPAVWKLSIFLGVVALLTVPAPLVNLIGYESAALFGVLAGFGTLWSMERSWDDFQLQGVSAHRVESILVDFFRVLGWNLLVLLPPMGILTLNSLRVPNCNPGAGYVYWLLLPVVSVVVAQTLVFAAHALAPRTRWKRRALVWGALAASLAMFGWQLAMEPPIVGYQLFLGYFGGSIYDEALALPKPLLWYRGLCLLGSAALLLWLESYWRKASFRPWEVSALCSVVLSLTLVLGWVNRAEWFGIDLDGEDIAEKLGGRLETEHFVIYFPANSEFADRLKDLEDDHEFRYAQMKDFFGTDPVVSEGKKVRSYVYPNREVKGALMGGRRTLVARLWLGEMHIMWRGHGDHLLAHELAHIFTKPFGTGPLSLSTRWGVGINMGLVEGIATAADWPYANMNPHQATAALKALDRAPDLRKLLGASGFWSQSSSRSYTVVGSFIRFVVDQYGIEKLKVAYGHGEFQAAYGKPLEELVVEWEAFIDTQALDERQVARARYLYDRPSIFKKTCARAIAEWRRQASIAASSGEIDEAIKIYQKVLENDPDNVRYQLELARFLTENGRYDQAEEWANRAIATKPGIAFEAQARELLGDVFWFRGDRKQAATYYKTCLSAGLPISQERLVSVKMRSVESQSEVTRNLALDYLLENRNQNISMFYPTEWVRNEPGDPFGQYLVARRLLGAGEYAHALRFSEAAAGGMGNVLLNSENSLTLVRIHYGLGDLASAREELERLKASEAATYREAAAEWIARVNWRATRNTVEGVRSLGE